MTWSPHLPQRKAIIVNRNSDGWALAIGRKWKYIDPDVPTERRLKDPIRPTLEVTSDTPQWEVENFKIKYYTYNDDLRKYESRKEAVGNIHTYIRLHITTSDFLYILNETSVYRSLQILRDRLAPTDLGRKSEIIWQYDGKISGDFNGRDSNETLETIIRRSERRTSGSGEEGQNRKHRISLESDPRDSLNMKT